MSALFSVGVTSCDARVDGTSQDYAAVAGTQCENDLVCGPGRHCAADSICSIECSTTPDCAALGLADTVCSPCGRCVTPTTDDVGCLSATDIPCSNSDTCVGVLDDRYECGTRGYCQRRCTDDAQCTDIGKGWLCDSSQHCTRVCVEDGQCAKFGFRYSCSLPPGVNPDENYLTVDAVRGECVSRPDGVVFPEITPDDPPSAKYQGVWGWLVSASVKQKKVPLYNELNTTAIQYLLVKQDFDGPDVRFTVKWCFEELRDFSPDGEKVDSLFTVVRPDTTIDAILLNEFTARGVPEMKKGATFVTDLLLDLRGARLKNPTTDPLPDHNDLTDQWDQDRDGNPGMTSKLVGALNGELYQSQRSPLVFTVSVVDESHLMGLVKNDPDATILGATSALLVNDSYPTEYPEQKRSYFRAVKMLDDASCEDVLTLAAQSGSWLEYALEYDASMEPLAYFRPVFYRSSLAPPPPDSPPPPAEPPHPPSSLPPLEPPQSSSLRLLPPPPKKIKPPPPDDEES